MNIDTTFIWRLSISFILTTRISEESDVPSSGWNKPSRDRGMWYRSEKTVKLADQSQGYGRCFRAFGMHLRPGSQFYSPPPIALSGHPYTPSLLSLTYPLLKVSRLSPLYPDHQSIFLLYFGNHTNDYTLI